MPSTRTYSLITVALIALVFGIGGCNNNGTQSTSTQSSPTTDQSSQPSTDQSQDPAAAANLAPAIDTPTTDTSDQNQNYSDNDYDSGSNDTYGQPVLQAPDPPPPLPEYSQPDCPGDGYLWTPGYWSYAPQGYYWVPGVWARPPETAFLWTPGYWGFVGGSYRYHYGYWGPHIGFYGGINYGFGYVGVG